MADKAHLPDELRARIDRQRKRQRLVRFSFAITVAVTVILLFGVNQAQTLAPTTRNLHLLPIDDQLWMIDQHLELNNQGKLGGTFGLLRIDGDTVTTGSRFEGTVTGITLLPNDRVGITTGARFLEFDLREDGWPRVEIHNLDLNDPDTSAVVLRSGEHNWLCWTRGTEVSVRPLDQPDVAAHSLHKTSGAGAELRGVTIADRIWLSVRDTRNNELTLVAFRAGIEDAVDGTPDDATAPVPADAAPRARRTRIDVIERTKVTANVKRSSLAVMPGDKGDRPVVTFIRKDERTWGLLAYDPAEKNWIDGTLPPREKPPSGLDVSNFASIARQGDAMLVAFNDGPQVKLARGKLGAGGIEWQDAEVLPIDRTQGAAVYIVWFVLLFGVLLLMASQGVWLLLNRERPGDRTLAALLEKKLDTDTKKIKKPEIKLLYASSMARALALFIDIAITSPVIILLQDVYDFTWEQAYGFLSFGVATMDGSLLQTVMATLVTLLVLIIYSTVAEVFWGRTFGKALLRLRVVDVKGEQPATWRIVVRNLVKVFELVHFLVLLIPMVLMMMTGKQQRLGDILGGTFVIVDAVPEESPDDIDI
ncbi:MAG: RDD family protein [Planctomycetes bacterium]|nr:RDD family protein [Planctomycetota bacterium]